MVKIAPQTVPEGANLPGLTTLGFKVRGTRTGLRTLLIGSRPEDHSTDLKQAEVLRRLTEAVRKASSTACPGGLMRFVIPRTLEEMRQGEQAFVTIEVQVKGGRRQFDSVFQRPCDPSQVHPRVTLTRLREALEHVHTSEWADDELVAMVPRDPSADRSSAA